MNTEDDDGWTDEEAGPVSRPYTVTGGRTRPRGTHHFDLVDMVVRGAMSPDPTPSSPELRLILERCHVPVSVAELAALVGLPLGVVRVLLDDLRCENLIEVMAAAPRGVVTDQTLLRRVLGGLRALLANGLIPYGEVGQGSCCSSRAMNRRMPCDCRDAVSHRAALISFRFSGSR